VRSPCFSFARLPSHFEFDTPKSPFSHTKRQTRSLSHIYHNKSTSTLPSRVSFLHSTTISSSCRGTERLLTGTNDTACKSRHSCMKCLFFLLHPEKAMSKFVDCLRWTTEFSFACLLGQEQRASSPLCPRFCLS